SGTRRPSCSCLSAIESGARSSTRRIPASPARAPGGSTAAGSSCVRRRLSFLRRRPVPNLRVWPGTPYPLGATWDGEGTNFAIFSEHATGVELCIFDSPDDAEEAHRIEVVERTDLIWHIYLPDVRPGQLYGYRIDGPYDPAQGH